MTSCTLYKLTTTESDKIYIGQTTRPLKIRFSGHKSKARRSVDGTAIGNAIRRYGEDTFSIEPILICEEGAADEYEVSLISLYNTKVPNGYNVLGGGKGVYDSCESKLRGEDVWLSKVTEEQAKYIISCSDRTLQELCIEFGIGRHAITDIRSGRTWKLAFITRSTVLPLS